MKLKVKKGKTWNPDNGDFWYDLGEGYIKPTDFLDKEDAQQIESAQEILKEFENLLVNHFDEL